MHPMLVVQLKIYRLLAIVFLSSLSAAACGGVPAASTQPVTAETIAAPTTTPTAEATPEVELTPETTPAGPATLNLWLPEPFAPPRNADAAALLSQAISAFQIAQPTILINTRLKRVEGTGGIIESLLAASTVAPGALPDLILVRRGELAVLLQAGLARPLESRVSPAVLGDLYASALALGQLDGGLIGLPYALQIQHVAYLPPEASFARFADVLAGDRALVLPAGRLDGISDIFLVQYLSAGGTLVGGELGPLNMDALQTVLTFYQQAAARGLIDPTILNYPVPEDYEAGLVDGRITAAIVTSQMYLGLTEGGQALETAAIPAASGTPTTLVDGWMWVLVTNDAVRQNAALRFLDWMFDPARQTAYTQSINMLPSRRAAMRQWEQPAYATFAGNMLAGALPPLDENGSSAAARAMQNALVAVITGEATAEEAAQGVADQLAG